MGWDGPPERAVRSLLPVVVSVPFSEENIFRTTGRRQKRNRRPYRSGHILGVSRTPCQQRAQRSRCGSRPCIFVPLERSYISLKLDSTICEPQTSKAAPNSSSQGISTNSNSVTLPDRQEPWFSPTVCERNIAPSVIVSDNTRSAWGD